jgi:Tol biopolymer transport system component
MLFTRLRQTVLVVLAVSLVASLSIVEAQRKQPPGAGQKVNEKKKQPPAAKPIATLRGFPDWVTSVAFSPDGKTLAAGSYEVVKLFEVKTRKSIATFEIKGLAKALSFSPDGKLLASGSYQTVDVWDVASKKRVLAPKAHRGYVSDVVFSPDGKTLATASEDETVRLWSIPDGNPGRVFEGFDMPINGVAFSPDGKLLATAIGDETRVTKPGEVKVWNIASGEFVHELVAHEKVANSVTFSPDGKLLISTSDDEKVNVYDVTSGKALGFFDGHGRATNQALFSPDASIVLSAAGGRAKGKNDVKIWTRVDGQEVTTLTGHKGAINDIALSPDSKILASASKDETVALWDVSKFTAVKQLRVGIIGLDTSHVIAFTKILNDPMAKDDVSGCRVVAAYPKGSPDIESSTSRVPKYTAQMKELGVEIVDSIPALIEKVDVVLLETNDGRPHLEQILPVLKAGKRVFIDKPIAGSLTDAVAIFEVGRKYKVPLFSSSSLRFGTLSQEVRNGKIGKVKTCETTSPSSRDKTHPDLFWYGIHGVESLFTVMGTGCVSVKRTDATAGKDVVVGQWEDDRTGTFRAGSGYSGKAVGEKGESVVGKYDSYRPLLVEIVKFFRNGKPPVSEAETLEIYAFMEAADESKRQNGAEVTLESVMKKARAAAKKRVAELDK